MMQTIIYLFQMLTISLFTLKLMILCKKKAKKPPVIKSTPPEPKPVAPTREPASVAEPTRAPPTENSQMKEEEEKKEGEDKKEDKKKDRSINSAFENARKDERSAGMEQSI